jgi:small-conductance mechanosensitive channel
MMDLTEANMVEPDNGQGSNARRILWMVVSALGIVMTAGAVAGYLAEHQSQGGGPLGTAGVVVMALLGAIIIGLGYAIWRNAAALKREEDDLTRRERLNRNIMIGCLALGAVMGGTLAATGNLDIADPASGAFAILDDSPMPLVAALLIAFVWAGAMPVVAWLWHTRAIDEQEASAYRDGGYYAAYAYLILAPTWWILWRGGLLPEPNGVAIFFAFTFIWSAVWFWKKYR